MEIIEASSRPDNESEELVLIIGSFDGVHRGHQAVLQRAREYTTKSNILAVLSYSDSLFQSYSDHKGELTPEDEKVRLLEQFGVERYYWVNDTKEHSRMTVADLFSNYLSGLNIAVVVTGELLHFGNKNPVSSEELTSLCRQIGAKVSIVPLVKENGKKISSNSIQAAIENGAVEVALSLLGRPYTVTGTVIHGEKVGRKLGFPTANLGGIESYTIPRPGVYLGSVGIHEQGVVTDYWNALISAGYRPTVDGKGYLIEANLLDYSGDLYGKTISVSFLHFLREEKNFPSLDLLVDQMQQDKATAEKILKGS